MLRKIAALLCLLAAAYAKTPRPLADMAIPAPGGKKILLSQYRGKVMMIALITTSCAECVQSIEIFKRMQKDFGPQGLQIVVAAVNLSAKDDIGPFVDRYKPTFPVGYLDHDGFMKLADAGPQDRPYVPIIIFVDRRGVVHFQYSGNDAIMSKEEDALRAITNGLLKQ